MKAIKRNPRSLLWGFGPVNGLLYWPIKKAPTSWAKVGWFACADWQSCRNTAPGFVPGFPHLHRRGSETLDSQAAA